MNQKQQIYVQPVDFIKIWDGCNQSEQIIKNRIDFCITSGGVIASYRKGSSSICKDDGDEMGYYLNNKRDYQTNQELYDQLENLLSEFMFYYSHHFPNIENDIQEELKKEMLNILNNIVNKTQVELKKLYIRNFDHKELWVLGNKVCLIYHEYREAYEQKKYSYEQFGQQLSQLIPLVFEENKLTHDNLLRIISPKPLYHEKAVSVIFEIPLRIIKDKEERV